MGATKIEWCDFTFNPWRGCSKVSAGCDHCFAERQSKRNPAVLGEWGDDGRRAIAAESYWRLPIKWNEEAARDGVRRRVFCGSLMDVFEDRPELVAPRLRLFNFVGRLDALDWLLLTKRPQNITRLWPKITVHDSTVEPRQERQIMEPFGPHLWLGVSVENQAAADKRIPALLEIPHAKRFLSCEPLLGPVDLGRLCHFHSGYSPPEFQQNSLGRSWIYWVIAGGESGPNARPSHPDWFRGLRDQCLAAAVPFFFKQWGEWRPPIAGEAYNTAFGRAGKPPAFLVGPGGDVNCFYPSDSRGTTPEESQYQPMLCVGKKRAGRELDGREWNEFLILRADGVAP